MWVLRDWNPNFFASYKTVILARSETFSGCSDEALGHFVRNSKYNLFASPDDWISPKLTISELSRYESAGRKRRGRTSSCLFNLVGQHTRIELPSSSQSECCSFSWAVPLLCLPRH